MSMVRAGFARSPTPAATSPNLDLVAEDRYLLTISGRDRPGLAGNLFLALEGVCNQITDIGQITIRGHLVLCIEVQLCPDASYDDLAEAVTASGIRADGSVTVEVTPTTERMARDGRRLLVTLVSPSIDATKLGAVFLTIADCGGDVERIIRLADLDQPVADDVAPTTNDAARPDGHHRVSHHLLGRRHPGRDGHVGPDQGVLAHRDVALVVDHALRAEQGRPSSEGPETMGDVIIGTNHGEVRRDIATPSDQPAEEAAQGSGQAPHDGHGRHATEPRP